MATINAIQNKAESLMSNSVGQRPTDRTVSLSLRPERAIAKCCEMAHDRWLMPTVGSGLRLLWVALFRRAMPYANAKRALLLTILNPSNSRSLESTFFALPDRYTVDNVF